GHTGEVVTPIRAVHHAHAHGRDLADLQSRAVLIVDVALLGCGRLHEVGDLVRVAGPAGVDGLGDTTGHRVAGQRMGHEGRLVGELVPRVGECCERTHTLTQITVVGLVCDGLVEVRHGSGHGAVLGDDRQHGDTGRVDLGAQRVECGQLALHGRKTVLGELAVHVSHVLEA